MGVQIVRSALSLLEQEGLVYSRERRGTFVRLERNGTADKPAETALRCITFLERPDGTAPEFVRADYLQGYTEALEREDVRMRILPCRVEEGRWESLFSPNFTFPQQGCVLINLFSAPLMRWLNERQLPFVVQSNKAYSDADLPPHHSVYINKFHGGFEATQHLIGLGHRRIGFVGTVSPEVERSHDVYGGYHAALACEGLRVRREDVLDLSTVDVALAVEPVRRFLDRTDRAPAFVTVNDAAALAMLEAAAQLGLRVPEEISVVGFDDLPQAAGSRPPLTTVANPRTWLGRAAVQMLFEVSAGKFTAPQSRALEGSLVLRESTGPPVAARGG